MTYYCAPMTMAECYYDWWVAVLGATTMLQCQSSPVQHSWSVYQLCMMQVSAFGEPGVLHVVIAQCGITTVGKVLHMVTVMAVSEHQHSMRHHSRHRSSVVA